jgi:uncharacterized surface protein with fasciclin (FAS1) repeats
MILRLATSATLGVALVGLAFAADSNSTLFERVAASANHTILLSAITETGQVKALNDKKSSSTLFAPTDDAFKKLGEAELNKLINDKQRLKKVVEAHIVAGKVLTTKELKDQSVKDPNGFAITTADGIRIGGAKVIGPDLESKNGVMHVIDAVLLPK